MNLTQFNCLLVLSIFAIIGFGPISPTCLIGMYVVITRPRWFLELTRDLYAHSSTPLYPLSPSRSVHPLAARIKCFLALLGLFILDIAPVPVTSTIGLIIVLARPRWFYVMVEDIYFRMKGENS
jgi:hypothetical protein